MFYNDFKLCDKKPQLLAHNNTMMHPQYIGKNIFYLCEIL